MSRSPAPARRTWCSLVVGAGLVGALLSTGSPASAAPEAAAGPPLSAAGTDVRDFVDGTYIVRFTDEPAATYDGGLSGLAATAPARGKQIEARSGDVREYARHLASKQDAALAEVGATPFYRYTTVLNGVAVDLTADQARRLAKASGVRSIVPDALRQPMTDTSPDFLGLTGRFWRAAGGRDDAGSGVVVGVLDTGIWPESPSFAPNDTPVPEDWAGECVAGEEFTASACNGKLIGARYYTAGFGVDQIAPDDYLSPRDGDGHGSHTASTAAGNHVEDVVVDGTDFGSVTGMAPGAKVAAYKVCWSGVDDADGCTNSDSVKAIEDAVNDGVDVINYSIGSTSESTVVDEVELAFLDAAAAGVFVSASAGNSGPGASTLDHPSPWVTTVAASTHKINEKVLELADGRRFVGASSTGPLPELTPMVLAADAAAADATVEEATLCALGSLDPAEVAGKLVVCERGVVDRIEKSRAVVEAGGAGMVMINPTDNSLNGDLHFVPSVHLDVEAYEPVTTYVATDADPRGRIVDVLPGESDTRVPEVADFSSRGPSTTTGGDILKPDISAPGVDVLAAVAPPFHFGRDYDLISGTSMAAPHIAGLAAVLIQLHPDWSPMAVKSALMTTAIDHVSTADPFAQGAGFVQPEKALNPGLVFDHGVIDWLGYLEHETGFNFPGIQPVEGSQLNQASIAIGALAGRETVTRTVTNVADRKATYRVTRTLPGVDVQLSDRVFTLEPGESKTLEITFVRGDAAYDEYTTGTLKLVSSRTTVRIPLAVRPVPAAVEPSEIVGEVPSGSADITVTAGFTGTMSTSVAGLVGAAPEQDSVTGDPGAFDFIAPSDPGDAVDTRTMTVGEGATLLRADIDGAADADLDLWLYRVGQAGPELVAFSATGSADEQVTLVDPAPGEYVAYVHGFAVPTAAAGAYAYTQWVVGSEDAGNLTVTPQSPSVRVGEETTVTASWSGLDPTQRYLGWVGFYDGQTLAGRTVVAVG